MPWVTEFALTSEVKTQEKKEMSKWRKYGVDRKIMVTLSTSRSCHICRYLGWLGPGALCAGRAWPAPVGGVAESGSYLQYSYKVNIQENQ